MTGQVAPAVTGAPPACGTIIEIVMKTRTSLLDHRPAAIRCGTLLAMGLGALPLHGAPAAKEPTDPQINAAVDNRILFDSSVQANDIDIKTTNGIVMLSGTVPDLLAKERATRIAEAVKGVLGVVNDITVKPFTRADEQIRQDIGSALQAEPATQSLKIDVNVTNGMVTLTGTVDSAHEQELADAAAKSVRGVREVKNDLALSNLNQHSDQEIADEVTAILRRDVWTDDIPINAKVHDGIVTLTGTVGTLMEKNRAHTDALTTGVTAVDDSNLLVQPWAEVGSMMKSDEIAIKPDNEIRKAVSEAFALDPRVRKSKPEVSVSKGTITLSGEVGSEAAKEAAEQDAQNTVGVWLVRNKLAVNK